MMEDIKGAKKVVIACIIGLLFNLIITIHLYINGKDIRFAAGFTTGILLITLISIAKYRYIKNDHKNPNID